MVNGGIFYGGKLWENFRLRISGNTNIGGMNPNLPTRLPTNAKRQRSAARFDICKMTPAYSDPFCELRLCLVGIAFSQESDGTSNLSIPLSLTGASG